MAGEESFLAAIKSRPEDRSVRLVYADWLEERGDSRGELIRIEEQMRSLPIYSDRYWELKPRRNALREACEAKWLLRLKYGTDYEPVFREVPDGWRERWRLLREFTERWHGVPVGDVGRHQREIEDAERELKVELPPAIREWIAYSHDLIEHNSFGILRDRYHVTRLHDVAAVSLLLLGEGNVGWAVSQRHLHLPDPPVDWYLVNEESVQEGRFEHQGLWTPHVTSFVFVHLSTYLHGTGGGFGSAVEINAELLRQLAEAFAVYSPFDDLRVFERPNMIARLGACHYSDGDRLEFDVWKKVRRTEVPDFLWQLARRRQGGFIHGMFVPER